MSSCGVNFFGQPDAIDRNGVTIDPENSFDVENRAIIIQVLTDFRIRLFKSRQLHDLRVWVHKTPGGLHDLI